MTSPDISHSTREALMRGFPTTAATAAPAAAPSGVGPPFFPAIGGVFL